MHKHGRRTHRKVAIDMKTKTKNGNSTKTMGEILGFVIFLFMAFYLFPKFGFVTDKYVLWLPIGFWTTVASTLFRILKESVNSEAFKNLFEVGNLLPSIYSTYALIMIYPFNFEGVGYPIVDSILPLSFTIALWVMTIISIVRFLRFLVLICLPQKPKNIS